MPMPTLIGQNYMQQHTGLQELLPDKKHVVIALEDWEDIVEFFGQDKYSLNRFLTFLEYKHPILKGSNNLGAKKRDAVIEENYAPPVIKENYNPPPFTEGHDSFGEGGVYSPGDPGL